MARFRGIALLPFLLGLATAMPGVSTPAAAGNKDAVKQDSKLAPGYLQLPRMAVPVRIEGTDASRQLEVEMWVYVADPQLMIKLTAVRSVVADEIRENLKKNTAETYMSAEEGPTAIKEIARDAVEKQIGKDVPADILIKSLLVR